MSDMTHLRVERVDDSLVVHFLDTRIVAELAISTLGSELYSIVNRPDCQKLVLDFSTVQFLSSAMLGKLISANRKMRDKGGTLRLCEVCSNIRTILKYTCLDQLLDIRATQAEAIAAPVPGGTEGQT